MFGIGLGELLLILLVIFIVSPRDIPRAIRKIGQLFSSLEKWRGELAKVKQEVKEAAHNTSTSPSEPPRRVQKTGRRPSSRIQERKKRRSPSVRKQKKE